MLLPNAYRAGRGPPGTKFWMFQNIFDKLLMCKITLLHINLLDTFKLLFSEKIYSSDNMVLSSQITISS